MNQISGNALAPGARQFSGQGAAAPVLFTGFGDSITGQSIYFPKEYSEANTQPWTASTVYGNSEVVQRNGEYFVAFPSGGTSGATPPAPGATNDGGINWAWLERVAVKQGTSYLFWAEAFSNEKMRWDMSDGYAGPWFGLTRIIMRSRGANYAPGDTANFNNGAKGTLVINPTDGGIDGVTITSPGYGTGGVSMTGITTSTGSGAAWTHIRSCAGNYGVGGNTTTDMVATLSDVVASTSDIIVVCGARNDITAGTTYAVIIANLKYCYETLMNAGKKVIAVPIPPSGLNLTATSRKTFNRVNRWIRAYVRSEIWANPSKYRNIALADPNGFMTDGTSASPNDVIGGSGGVDGAMTTDGVHPSERGAMYIGYAVWQAAQQFIGPNPAYPSRSYSRYDGYDPTDNPGGNLLEGDPWEASKIVALTAKRSNGGNVYHCTQAGTTASSGGPTGTGSNITDGTAKWDYSGWPSGMSVMASASQALAMSGTTTGVTGSGTMPSGFTVGRQNGLAAGTLVSSIESPWSNGQSGQRWKLVFTLGGDTGQHNELWYIKLPFKNLVYWSLVAADLGVTPVQMDAELEISGVANVNYMQLYGPSGSRFYCNAGPSNGGVGRRIMNSSGEMLAIPNSGKLLLPSQPMILPASETTLSGTIYIGFDAGGGAGSATVTLYLNYIGVRKAGLA